MRAFGENQHMQAITDQAHADETNLSIIEAIIFALKHRILIEIFRSSQGYAVLGDIGFILGRVELDFHQK